MKKIILILFLPLLALGQNDINISKLAKMNSYCELSNYQDGLEGIEKLKAVYQYIDSFPFIILDSTTIEGFIFGKVGIPFFKINSSNLQTIFSEGVKTEETVLFNKKIKTYTGFVFVYFSIDVKKNKFYKLHGFRNFDLNELVEDLKSKQFIKTEKEFMQKVSIINEFNFKKLRKINKESYKHGALLDITATISTGRKGKDHYRIENK